MNGLRTTGMAPDAIEPRPAHAAPYHRPVAPDADSPFDTAPADAWLDSAPTEAAGMAPDLGWRDWRLSLLVVCAVLGCVLTVMLARTLAAQPVLAAAWVADTEGRVRLAGTSIAALQPHQGAVLTGVTGGAGAAAVTVRPDALALQRSARWLVDDAERLWQRNQQEGLVDALARSPLALDFDDGASIRVDPQPRGVGRLPAPFWLSVFLGFFLSMVGMAVLLTQPSVPNLLYAVMAGCQAGNLTFIGIESTLDLGLALPFVLLDMPLRMAFDLVTTAALVHAVCLHPRRLPGRTAIATAVWALAALMIAVAEIAGLPGRWWWAQGVTTGLGLVSVGLLTASYRLEPHPAAIVLRRFVAAAVGTWVLLTAAIIATDGLPGAPQHLAAVGSMVWYVFLGSLLLLAPFLVKSHLLLREFSLLAAVSTIGTSLDLLFVTVFSLGTFPSLALSLLISLAVYSGARQWTLAQSLGSSVFTAERMFELLYRIAREVEVRPDRAPVLLSQLLAALFEPMDIRFVDAPATETTVAGDGSTMRVPLPALAGEVDMPTGSVLVRYAQRGRRLFTDEDARLVDRVVEQLRRAVAFDKAVEQGRKEERLRLAQDLHDDIGARLLTLMYQATSPEMEDYLRHTLQDLKTLTRGLAAPNHRLSHAAGEWKADLTQRLLAAQIELRWEVAFDEDVLLSVGQWSALTRVLRELVSNAIAHSQATRLDVEATLVRDRVDLCVTDDGIGRKPHEWSHGLGLGGIRKRVKQLGGSVEWTEVAPRGIRCRVGIRHWSTHR